MASAWTPELYENMGVTGSEDAENEPRYPDSAIAVTGVEGARILADPLSEGALLPGRTATYQTSFNIPEDWRGTKKTYLVLKDYQFVVPGTRLAPGDDDTVLQFSLPHDQCPTCDVTVSEGVEAFGADLGDSLVYKNGIPVASTGTVGGLGPDAGVGQSGESSSGAGANDGTNAPSGKRAVASMVKSGDKAGWTVACLVATAAVAGMAAYTACRLENERASEEGGDEVSE